MQILRDDDKIPRDKERQAQIAHFGLILKHKQGIEREDYAKKIRQDLNIKNISDCFKPQEIDFLRTLRKRNMKLPRVWRKRLKICAGCKTNEFAQLFSTSSSDKEIIYRTDDILCRTNKRFRIKKTK